MEWWQVSIITLLVYWIVGVAIYEIKKEDEDFAVCWGMGIVFPILYILFYPLRVWEHYKLNIKVYKKHNLSYWEKLIGKGLCNGKKMWFWEIKKFYKNREDVVEMTNFNYCPYCGKKFPESKKCKECNELFIPKRNDAKYCKECASKVRERQAKEWFEKIKADPEKYEKRKEQARIKMREIRAKMN